VSKTLLKKTHCFPKNALFSNMCAFLSHCFETKNYHCLSVTKIVLLYITNVKWTRAQNYGLKSTYQNDNLVIGLSEEMSDSEEYYDNIFKIMKHE